MGLDVCKLMVLHSARVYVPAHIAVEATLVTLDVGAALGASESAMLCGGSPVEDRGGTGNGNPADSPQPWNWMRATVTALDVTVDANLRPCVHVRSELAPSRARI